MDRYSIAAGKKIIKETLTLGCQLQFHAVFYLNEIPVLTFPFIWNGEKEVNIVIKNEIKVDVIKILFREKEIGRGFDRGIGPFNYTKGTSITLKMNTEQFFNGFNNLFKRRP